MLSISYSDDDDYSFDIQFDDSMMMILRFHSMMMMMIRWPFHSTTDSFVIRFHSMMMIHSVIVLTSILLIIDPDSSIRFDSIDDSIIHSFDILFWWLTIPDHSLSPFRIVIRYRRWWYSEIDLVFLERRPSGDDWLTDIVCDIHYSTWKLFKWYSMKKWRGEIEKLKPSQ